MDTREFQSTRSSVGDDLKMDQTMAYTCQLNECTYYWHIPIVEVEADTK